MKLYSNEPPHPAALLAGVLGNTWHMPSPVHKGMARCGAERHVWNSHSDLPRCTQGCFGAAQPTVTIDAELNAKACRAVEQL